jgi:hypothetical protein
VAPTTDATDAGNDTSDSRGSSRHNGNSSNSRGIMIAGMLRRIDLAHTRILSSDIDNARPRHRRRRRGR